MSMVARKVQIEEQEQVQTKKRIKRIKTKVTLGEKFIVAAMIAAAFAILSVVIFNYASIYSTNKEIYQLEATIGQQIQKNEGLTLQVVELSAPDRILNLAYEELGMDLDDDKVKVVQN